MSLSDNKNIYLRISQKQDGSMKNSRENHSLFFRNEGLESKNIITAGLVDTNRVVIVDDINTNQKIEGCDALITSQENNLLALTVADCLPIYFYDNHKRVVALAHAGWRGILLDITHAVVEIFFSHYGSNIEDLEVYIGPHIKDCCFEVKDDVLSKFKPAHCIMRNGKTYINLAEAVKDQLLSLKIREDRISISAECTACLDNKYFSYRRDKPKELETMIAYIGLK